MAVNESKQNLSFWPPFNPLRHEPLLVSGQAPRDRRLKRCSSFSRVFTWQGQMLLLTPNLSIDL